MSKLGRSAVLLWPHSETAVAALILDRTDQLLYHQRLYTSTPSDSSYYCLPVLFFADELLR